MTTPCIVLIVDDEPLIRAYLASKLEDEGCTTFEAHSAAEAISVLEGNSDIRVVFTDIQMPGQMDGIQLAKYVRKRWPPTIIVVSSGKVRPVEDDLANDIPFLAKPYDDRRLSDVINDMHERLAAAA